MTTNRRSRADLQIKVANSYQSTLKNGHLGSNHLNGTLIAQNA